MTTHRVVLTIGSGTPHDIGGVDADSHGELLAGAADLLEAVAGEMRAEMHHYLDPDA